MVAILEKSEHNVDFHSIVDFVEESPLRYALTFKPTVYVSHIQQFWSTARIETTEKGTKILATVNSILRTVTESSLRRNLKLQDEEGISSLPDVKLFENLTLMGYNISPNQKFSFQKGRIVPIFDTMLVPQGEGSGTPTEPHHTPSPEAQLLSSTTPLLSTLPSVPTAPIPTVTLSDTPLLRQYTIRARIAQSSALPPVTDEPASPLRDGRNLDEGEAAAKRVSDNTEEMATVLTSMDATTILASGVAEVSTSSGSIPTDGPLAAEVPTGSDVVPTTSQIFATATVVTPYTRRKGKETMVESKTPKKKKVQEHIDAQVVRELEEQMAREDQRMSDQVARDVEIARIHAEEELQIMIDGLDRNNETVAKYLQEYHQFAIELPLERRIELISDLIRYQDNYAKDFRGMTFEEIEAKFTIVWKQIENFIPMGSKEEAERFKRKGIMFEQESVKKLKTSEEVPEEVKSPDEVPKEKVKVIMQLVPINWKVHTEGQRSYWKVTRLGGRLARYQFFVDMLKHLDREDLNQLWALVKESLNIRPPTIEWKLYDICGVHQVTSKDKEIFMLVEKDYPLRKGLAIGMISCKLQVETYSKMANDLILKIYKIASGPRQQVIEFLLPEEVPTASEESSLYQKKRDATAVKIALLLKSRRNKPTESEGFEQIIDFLNGSSVRYTLTTSPTIRTSCIKQFWSTAKIKTVNDKVRVQALINAKRVNIKESSSCRTLKLDDEEGTSCLANDELFTGLANIDLVLKPPPGMNLVALWHHQSSVLPQTRSLTFQVDHQLRDMSHHQDIYDNPLLTKKVFANLKIVGTGFFGVITPLFENMLVPAAEEVGKAQVDSSSTNKIEKLEDRVHKLEEENRILKEKSFKSVKIDTVASVEDKEESFKHGRMIADMDEDVKVNLEEALVKAYNLDLQHSEKVVTTAEPTTTDAQVPMVSALRRRRGVVIQDPEETVTSVIVHIEVQSKDKEKVKRSERQNNAVMRYQALKRKPLTEAQARKNMMIYLKNMAGFKINFYKGMTYSEIRPLFEKHYNSNQAFLERVEEEQMLNNVRLEVEKESEMSLELLRLVKRQLNEGPPVKRKLAPGSSTFRATRAKTSSLKDDVPYLTVFDDDEGLHNVLELKDAIVCHLKISAITLPA
uniref:Xylulose kinase-1 n=1 Tax=Tanacetum cinerariifolium TaxID=118510 RepID=A0A6L2N6Y0_TANCI|nr:hypothetical protein [Tanacetum cinerariifolium]